MSQHRPIDLSSLPPEVRRLVEQQLAKLPPQAREKLLREGSPIVEKMLAKLQAGGPPPMPGKASVRQGTAAARDAAAHAGTAAAHAKDVLRQAARLAPRGHYNETIRPGDNLGGGRWLLVVLVAALVAAYYWN
jgi:hypothetical protein